MLLKVEGEAVLQERADLDVEVEEGGGEDPTIREES